MVNSLSISALVQCGGFFLEILYILLVSAMLHLTYAIICTLLMLWLSGELFVSVRLE